MLQRHAPSTLPDQKLLSRAQLHGCMHSNAGNESGSNIGLSGITLVSAEAATS